MASRGLGTLTLDLIARIGGFEKGLDKAARHADKRMREIEARANKFGKAIGVALAAGATAAGAALLTMTKNAIDAADRLNDISQRLGVGTEALSAWGYAAQQSGTDIEALNTGLTRFTRNVAAAVDEGSRQEGLFRALGVSVKDAAGNLRSVEDLLPDVAQKFKELNNATLESALAQELFGRSGTNLLQFLNLGSDGLAEMEEKARSLGIVISQDTAQKADEFNDQLNDLSQLARGAGLMLAEQLLPALTKLVEQTRAALQEGEPLAKLIEWIGDQADATSKDLEFMAGTVRDLTNMFGGLYDGAAATLGVLKGIATLDWGKVKQSIRAGIDADKRIGRGFNSTDLPDFSNVQGAPKPDFSNVTSTPARETDQSALMAFLRDPTGAGSGSKKKAGKSDAEKEAEALARAYQSMNDRLREQVALFGMTGEAAQLRYELEHGELAKLDPIKKAELLQMAERLDVMRDEAEVQKQLDEVNKRREESVAQVLDDIAAETAALGLDADAQERLNMLRYAGVDANSAYGQSIIEAATAMQEARRQTEDQIELMDSFRQETSNAIADVVTGAKSLKEAFVDMFDTLAARITQMIAERWIEQLFGQQGSTGGGTQGGDWLGSLFGAFFGGGGGGSAGSLASLFSGSGFGFATGGYTGPGGRNELAGVVHAGEVVWSQDDIARFGGVANVEALRRGGGGGGTVNQTFVVNGTPDRRTAEQMARSSGREARRGMARTGG